MQAALELWVCVTYTPLGPRKLFHRMQVKCNFTHRQFWYNSARCLSVNYLSSDGIFLALLFFGLFLTLVNCCTRWSRMYFHFWLLQICYFLGLWLASVQQGRAFPLLCFSSTFDPFSSSSAMAKGTFRLNCWPIFQFAGWICYLCFLLSVLYSFHLKASVIWVIKIWCRREVPHWVWIILSIRISPSLPLDQEMIRPCGLTLWYLNLPQI